MGDRDDGRSVGDREGSNVGEVVLSVMKRDPRQTKSNKASLPPPIILVKFSKIHMEKYEIQMYTHYFPTRRIDFLAKDLVLSTL